MIIIGYFIGLAVGSFIAFRATQNYYKKKLALTEAAWKQVCEGLIKVRRIPQNRQERRLRSRERIARMLDEQIEDDADGDYD